MDDFIVNDEYLEISSIRLRQCKIVLDTPFMHEDRRANDDNVYDDNIKDKKILFQVTKGNAFI